MLGAVVEASFASGDGGDRMLSECSDPMEVEVQVEVGDLPIILVPGSNGRVLRTLMSKACSGFVRIPGGLDGREG